jgi:hypothetical protein
MSIDMFRPNALGFSCDPTSNTLPPAVVFVDRELNADAETERSLLLAGTFAGRRSKPFGAILNPKWTFGGFNMNDDRPSR